MAKTLPPLAELREWLRYDAETGFFYWIKTQNGKTNAGSPAGTICEKGYVKINYNKRPMLAHRLAWLFACGEDPGPMQIDHINCDRADNRICNLRLATNANNMQNTRKRGGTTSQYKGVSWQEAKGKWRADIRANGKQMYLGLFKDEHEAYLAYCAAAARHFGEFANFG